MKHSVTYLILEYLALHDDGDEAYPEAWHGLDSIFANRLKARDFWEKQIPKSVHRQRTAILKKHGFTRKSWREILRYSNSLLFMPTAEMTACNKEIRELISKQKIINRPPYLKSYLASLLKNECKNKNPKIERIKHKTLKKGKKRGINTYPENYKEIWVYRIKPQYLYANT